MELPSLILKPDVRNFPPKFRSSLTGLGVNEAGGSI